MSHGEEWLLRSPCTHVILRRSRLSQSRFFLRSLRGANSISQILHAVRFRANRFRPPPPLPLSPHVLEWPLIRQAPYYADQQGRTDLTPRPPGDFAAAIRPAPKPSYGSRFMTVVAYISGRNRLRRNARVSRTRGWYINFSRVRNAHTRDKTSERDG